MPLSQNGKLDRSLLPKYKSTIQDTYVAPRNITESKICIIYSEILYLSAEQVGINHDFFKLGGNSIMAIDLLYRLQLEFKIGLNDIFKLRTPAKIAKLASSIKNGLYHKLAQMKGVYDKLASYAIGLEQEIKKIAYFEQVEQLQITKKIKCVRSVLLTGATGHLGCNILYQLLHETKYRIHLLIRAKTNTEAYTRINSKFRYYFDTGLDNYQDRMIIIAADIEKLDLGISKKQYQSLVTSIDSIIHSAALVKHYGDYATFYQTNVQATTNLLELSRQTRLKDFHYISTLSILTNCSTSNSNYQIWTENDERINFENSISNVYNKTKYEGELTTLKYR